MGDKNYILWAVLYVIFVACAWWHIRENKRLTRQWQKALDSDAAQRLKRFAWSRTTQLLAVLFCSIVIIIMYDGQLRNAQNVKANEVKTTPRIADNKNKPKPTPIAKPTPPVAKVQAPPVDDYYPPLPTNQEATPINAIPVAAIVVQPGNKVPSMDDIYNPEKTHNDSGSTMDSIKKRYEDMVVIYMFLSKCGKTTPADWNIIITSLNQEIKAANAPIKLQSDIISSAQGSYKEIYAQSACDANNVAALNTQFQDFLKTLSAGLHH